MQFKSSTSKKKILITGSHGFIATNLIQQLSKINSLFLIGVDSGISKSKNICFTEKLCLHHQVDLLDQEKLKELLEGVDVVIHLAARGNVVESIENPISNLDSNVCATLSLLEAMRATDVRKIVFSSTGGALMGNATPPVTEKTIPLPISPYGASKLACEGYLSAYSESFDFSSVVLRFGNVYGNYSSHKVGVINKWIRASIENKEITIYGNGSASRDYIHVEDLCQGIIAAMNRLLTQANVTSHERYHLANNREITLSELNLILSRIAKKEIIPLFFPERKGEVKRNYSDCSLANKELKFNPKVCFDDGIGSLYQWILENEY